MDDRNKLPTGFAKPTSSPPNHAAQLLWQSQNRRWWESNPMRYDWGRKINFPEFSREFYEEIDRRHFSDAARYTPPKIRPFDEIIPFNELGNSDVLEIGVGNGSHAQLIGPFCKSYTGIDLTDYSIQSTQRRFEIFGLQGVLEQMDAEHLAFPANSFDFIWSWGVIHHSSNTQSVLREMRRVLRPGGRAVVMVYHRSFLYYYIFTGLFRGILGGGLFREKSLHRLTQLYSDGAIARFYTIKEWRNLVSQFFRIEHLSVKGQKSELFPLPPSRIKEFLMRIAPDRLSRLVLNDFKQGSFLISTLQKV